MRRARDDRPAGRVRLRVFNLLVFLTFPPPPVLFYVIQLIIDIDELIL